jgi:hypothetical protein
VFDRADACNFQQSEAPAPTLRGKPADNCGDGYFAFELQPGGNAVASPYCSARNSDGNWRTGPPGHRSRATIEGVDGERTARGSALERPAVFEHNLIGPAYLFASGVRSLRKTVFTNARSVKLAFLLL